MITPDPGKHCERCQYHGSCRVNDPRAATGLKEASRWETYVKNIELSWMTSSLGSEISLSDPNYLQNSQSCHRLPSGILSLLLWWPGLAHCLPMEAAKTKKPVIYMRRRPELTPCYRILQNHLNTFISDRDREFQPLPNYVIKEFDAFLECGIPAYGCLRLVCKSCKNMAT
jgi:hypothetical protein